MTPAWDCCARITSRRTLVEPPLGRLRITRPPPPKPSVVIHIRPQTKRAETWVVASCTLWSAPLPQTLRKVTSRLGALKTKDPVETNNYGRTRQHGSPFFLAIASLTQLF